MNVFYFDLMALLASFALVAFVFLVSYLLCRQPSKHNRLLASALLALASLFCIETLWVTWSLIPSADTIAEKSFTETGKVLYDRVSASGMNMGDLYLAWMLTISCIVSAYFVRRSGPKPVETQLRQFYDHFAGTGAVAVVLTSMFYIYTVLPGYFDHHIEIFDKILFRGPIPYITVGLFIWVLLNVALLARQVLFQRQQDFAIECGFNATDKEAAMAQASHHSALKWRLEDINNTAQQQSEQSKTINLSEYAQLVDQQSEMERAEIDVSILYLHTAMWAIPVLGFLGTVWGIAEAVANLIPLMKGLSAANLGGSELADSLAGLGVAFDTTLVALSLSIPAMALISLLEKSAYEDMLVRNRIILRHVKAL